MNRQEKKKISSDAYRKAWEDFHNEIKKCGCYYCSETEPCCLEFHHVITSEKEFNISSLSLHNATKLLNELMKCSIICANCHNRIHYGILEQPPLIQLSREEIKNLIFKYRRQARRDSLKALGYNILPEGLLSQPM